MYNETLNNIIDVNVVKSGCISLANGFMRLIRWGNNPNNETIVYIYLMSYGAINRAYTSYPRLTTHSNFKIIPKTFVLETSYLWFVVLRRIIALMTKPEWYVKGIIQIRKPWWIYLLSYITIVLSDLQKLGLKWGFNPLTDWMCLLRYAPYLVMIQYLQRESKPISRVVL